MIDNDKHKKIFSIWDNYINSDRVVLDAKGKEIEGIGELRVKAIVHIKKLISDYLEDSLDIYEFKTNLDSFNKKNNLWGFTATKGQMFFNQLVKNSQDDIEKLSQLLKESISEPSNLKSALLKIESLEKYCITIFSKASDKSKAPNPGSVGYFLSYFWQIYDNEKWPIVYTSLTKSYEKIDIWEDQKGQKNTYEFFYDLNEEIKDIR
jgi:hypothetical protein